MRKKRRFDHRIRAGSMPQTALNSCPSQRGFRPVSDNLNLAAEEISRFSQEPLQKQPIVTGMPFDNCPPPPRPGQCPHIDVNVEFRGRRESVLGRISDQRSKRHQSQPVSSPASGILTRLSTTPAATPIRILQSLPQSEKTTAAPRRLLRMW